MGKGLDYKDVVGKELLVKCVARRQYIARFVSAEFELQEPDEPPAAAAAAAAEEGEAGAAEDEARHLAQGSPVQQEKQASDERKKTWTSSCLKPFADSLSENVGDYFQDRLGQEL